MQRWYKLCASQGFYQLRKNKSEIGLATFWSSLRHINTYKKYLWNRLQVQLLPCCFFEDNVVELFYSDKAQFAVISNQFYKSF